MEMEKMTVWIIVLAGFLAALAWGRASKRPDAPDVGGPTPDSSPPPKPAWPQTDYWPEKLKRWSREIAQASERWGIDPHLLAALIWQESTASPTASRYEPKYMAEYVTGNPRWDPARTMGWTDQALATSWGLTQVLGTTAWSMGAHYPPERIVEPDLNVRLGAKYLRSKLDRWGWDVFRALLAYNGGDGAVFAYNRGRGYNLDYARKVLGYYKTFKPDGPHDGRY